MSAPANTIQLVEASALDEYPISAEDRLDSHYFVQWNLRRWDGSDFRKAAYKDPEVGFFGLELIFGSHKGTPVGTLSCDDETLAFDLHISLEKWKTLKKREPSPLHNWRKVRCDNGEIRYAHPVVTLVAQEALKSSRTNAAKVEARKLNKRLADLRDMVERIGAKQLLQTPAFVERFNDWLEQHHQGVQRREAMIRAALDQFTVENAS